MIKRLISNGLKARMGFGTVKMRTGKIKATGLIELTQIEQSEVGGVPGLIIPDSPKIIIEFSSVQSVDLMIKQLEAVKSLLSKQE